MAGDRISVPFGYGWDSSGGGWTLTPLGLERHTLSPKQQYE